MIDRRKQKARLKGGSIVVVILLSLAFTLVVYAVGHWEINIGWLNILRWVAVYFIFMGLFWWLFEIRQKRIDESKRSETDIEASS